MDKISISTGFSRFEKNWRTDPFEKQNVAGLFCCAYSIEDVIDSLLSSVYRPSATHPGRYDFIPGSSTAGAAIIDPIRDSCLKKEMVLNLKDGEITAANAASLSRKMPITRDAIEH